MNQPKKFTELLAGATKPTPADASLDCYAADNYERRTAMNHIRERLTPAVMREVWEALNGAVTRLSVLVETDQATTPEEHTYRQCRRALALLDGQEQPNKETKE